MLETVGKMALVLTAVLVDLATYAVRFVVVPLALVGVTQLVHQFTSAFTL